MNRRHFLKTAAIGGAALAATTCRHAFGAESKDKPNYIIIFNDDMGYGDVGCFGSEKNKTPRIDKMAKEGRRFTDFYVTSSVCTPSRASLMTGCYPTRVLGPSGVFFPNKIRESGLDPRHFTIAKLLKSVGYKTFHAGKWHLGDAVKFLPTKQGFDSFYGIPYSNGMYPSRSMKYARDCNFREGFSEQKLADLYAKTPKGKHPKVRKGNVPLMRDEECIEFPLDQTTITRRLADESIRFIEKSVKAKKPFFVYLANPMPHVPLHVSQEFEGKTGQGLYSDVIAEIDFNTGRVLDALKANGVDKNTLVIFTSDNGPWLIKGENSGSAKPLRAGKGSTYEGGQRVPCIMRWPARIPAGTLCSEIATAMDMMPTLAAMTGAKIPADIRCQPDGHNIENLMTGGAEEKSPYKQFYFGGNGAVRVGKWKYRQGPLHAKWSAPGSTPKENPRVTQLFNLAEDISESNNVIDQYPEVAERLRSLLSVSPNVSMVLFDPEPPHGARYEVKKNEVIDVDGGKGGEFEAVIAFSTATGAKCAVLVNGVEQEALSFPNVKSWSKKKTGKLTLVLKPGTNKIEIRNLGKRGVNLGYLDLKAK
jgi:arylsulfatase A-like enzyme